MNDTITSCVNNDYFIYIAIQAYFTFFSIFIQKTTYKSVETMRNDHNRQRVRTEEISADICTMFINSIG